MNGRRLRVLLLFGGRSAEHDVSCVSAVAAARALDPARYEVVTVGITREGRWVLAEDAQRAIEAGREALPERFRVDGPPVPVDVSGAAPASLGDALRVDVAIPLLHGPYGEDGTVQGVFELAGLPYVGSGVLGSAVAMDKVMTKRALEAVGIPVPRWRALRDGHDRAEFAQEVLGGLGLPCFVKPANLGSSIGVTKVHDRAELDAGIDLALRYDEWILAEEAVVGREIEVGILGDDPPEISLPGEIVPGDEFYSYDDKYVDDAARLLAPAPLSPAEVAVVQALAGRAFEACRVEAMARVDFFYEERGRGFLVNELNTIPGFTPISMYPRLWECSGVPYPELLDRLIGLALARHARRARRL